MQDDLSAHLIDAGVFEGSSRLGSILTLTILTGALSCSASASAVEILSTTSMPSVTWPKAENWPSSWGWAEDEELSTAAVGLARYADGGDIPVTCLTSLNSSGS